jgi:hypothetical protein
MITQEPKGIRIILFQKPNLLVSLVNIQATAMSPEIAITFIAR